MVKIISMSLDDEIIREIEDIKKTMGYNGRSETIRAAINMLSGEIKSNKPLTGHGVAIMIVVHKKKSEDSFIKSKHMYEDVTTTQIHNNICNDKCLEVFVLHGPAEKINSFASEIRKNKRTEYFKLVTP